jgi:sigma-E factor negative regulatory protein RseC
MIIEALNPVHGRVGQKVRIVMKSSSYLRGSAIVYGIPALALIAGAVLGKEVIGSLVSGFDPDLLSAISGFCFFVASFVAIKLWSGRLAGKTEMKPVIEEILGSESPGLRKGGS